MYILPNKGLSDDEIEEIRDDYGIVFPEDYKEFLKKYNGGETPMLECIHTDGFYSEIRALYGFKTGDQYTSIEEIPLPFDYDLEFWMENGLMPIGENLWGDLFMMNVKDAPGKVYYSDHEQGFQLMLLARSFKEFIGLFGELVLTESQKKEYQAIEESISRQVEEQGIAALGKEGYEQHKEEGRKSALEREKRKVLLELS